MAIRENMSRAIDAIVGLSNIANIVGSIITGRVVTVTLGNKWLGLFRGVTALNMEINTRY